MNPLSTAASALVLITLLITFGYILACWADPFPKCSTCTGSGRRRIRGGRAWRDCRRCRGTGHRLRLGRRIYNAVHQLAREGNR